MRLAIQSCFGNTPTAERELVRRLDAAARGLGWETTCCLTSTEIVRFQPDCVLASHFTSPKLTEFPTLGLMTNPPQYFRMFSGSLNNILSYDGYLTGSAQITEYLGDLLFSTGKKAAVSDFYFHLSCPRTQLVERDPNPRRLFYIGMRWDKGRHGTLFERLAGAVPLDAYGPARRWDDLPGVYRGQIPFDGTSVLDRIRESGAALCIHSAEHRAWGIPTMRIWEATAAGAVVITDVADFARQHFGDALLYIDMDRREEDVVAQIAGHMDWINRHPEQASQLVRRAHAIFCERFCLEGQLSRLPAFVEQVRQTGGYDQVGPACRAGPEKVPPGRRDLPLVEYIVRTGTRPAHFVDRCLASLLEQSYQPIGVIVVPLEGAEGAALQEVLARYQADFASFRILPPQPAGMRSQSLWAGLRAVTAPFFAVLDDDDRLHPNHVASVMELLRERQDVSLAHSAGIRVQEEAGFWENEPHLLGPTGEPIGEDRRLECFAGVDRAAMVNGERVLLSHGWIARSELLDERVLTDPNLPLLEDQYLHSLLILKGSTAFTFRPTAEWNWRSATRDNAIFHEDHIAGCRERIRMRLRFFPEVESQRRDDEAAESVQQQLRELRKEFEAFAWVGDPEMLALRRSTQALLLLRGLRRALRDWKALRGQATGGVSMTRTKGLRGFLSRMVSLGRE